MQNFTTEILAVAKEICSLKNLNFEIKFETKFITFALPGLKGYSGENSIYINHFEHDILINLIDEAKIFLILKLECSRFVQEVCYVLVPNGMNDLNISSPKLPKTGQKFSLPES